MKRMLKKKLGSLGTMLLLCSIVFAQDDTISRRIILIGDAGQFDASGRHPVVNAVKKYIPLDKKTTVLYLGDNLYKYGLPDAGAANYQNDRAVLDTQLLIADDKKEAQVLMIPGNHDWDAGREGGYEAIVRQQLYSDLVLARKNVNFYPKDGCAGPKEISIGTNITLILFDSQWWIHEHDKPEIESDCESKTKEELVTQINDIAARNANKLVIVACHHPFKSNGIHGGFFTLKQHIFPLTDLKKTLYVPLPVIGSIYPISRSVFGSPQDLKYPAYQDMVKQVTQAVKESAPNVIFVSGHDHNLQHIVEENTNYIVSGGGCKINRTSRAKNSRFNSPAEGFGVLEVSFNKNVSLTFYEVKDTAVNKAYSASLFNFAKIDTATTALDTTSTQPVADPFVKYRDTITIRASDDYDTIGGMKKMFMGENYRREWNTPVNMQVFNIRQERGGMRITGLGGGKQTKTLQLEDSTGKRWILRSLNKDPKKAVPENLRETIVQDMAMEINSATHPYAALAIPGMAQALNIVTAKPKVVFVPDDPSFGLYRPLFANNVCILEERDASLDGKETRTSAKLFNKMLEDNDHRPLQQKALEARLLDIIVGDFDRHLDQWRWGGVDTGKGRLYYPIPRDRDQAFFNPEGVMMKMVTNRFLPYLKGFRRNIPSVNWFNYSARDFDRIFLTELDKKIWDSTVTLVQAKLTDSVIRKSIQAMPSEIFVINGDRMIRKAISRRNKLPEAAAEYYKFISSRVNVIGSNEQEFFKVSRHPDGLQIKVLSRSKGNDTSFVMYNRVFDPKVTKEIRLYGLNDDDVFEIDDSASSRIKLRIIGGKGYDTFDIRGNVENFLYDAESDSNFIRHTSKSKKRFSQIQTVNERSLFGFQYNESQWPNLTFGRNTDDGTLVGASLTHRGYGFRNFPYASDQKLSVLYAANRRAFQAKYHGEFNHITRNIDLLVNISYANPSLYNFFGLGSKARFNSALPNSYYQSRHTMLQGEALIRRRLFDILHIQLGPHVAVYNNSYAKSQNTIFQEYRQLGYDSASLFGKKTYMGGKFGVLINNQNDEIYPTRGINWYNEFTGLAGVKNSANYSAFKSDMSIYASWTERAGLVTILRFGGGRVLSKNYEFFQAMTIGSDNNLPGFRKNRFAGRRTIYGGIEMRLKLFEVNSFILPGTLGLTGFYSAARVRLTGEESAPFYGSYGGGIFYMPFRAFLISANAGFSRGERNINVSIGTKFNLTY